MQTHDLQNEETRQALRTPSKIISMLNLYEAYEFKLDRLAKKKSDLARYACQTNASDAITGCPDAIDVSAFETADLEAIAMSDTERTIPDLDMESFKNSAERGRASLQTPTPYSLSRFITNTTASCPDLLVSIEAIEEETDHAEIWMAVLENDILEEPVRAAGDACAKLDFISKILADPKISDPDFLSFAIQECVQALSIGESGRSDQSQDRDEPSVKPGLGSGAPQLMPVSVYPAVETYC